MSPSGPKNGHFNESTIRLARGSKIDRYIVLELLGGGGMGVVYKAFDPKLNRGIAIKLIKTKDGHHGERSDRSTRLLREAQALAQLNHPNVVRVHDVGTFGDNVFVAMEFVAGRTVRDWYRETKPGIAQALEVMRSAGRGLAAAHKAGLIHRDFKPDNIIVGEDGRVRVIDFGLARAGSVAFIPATASESKLEHYKPRKTQEPIQVDMQNLTRVVADHAPEAESGSEASSNPSSSNSEFLGIPLTRVGAVVGTPAYMAPEQHLGRSLDARADQFSFCAVLYEVLYAQRPFPGSSLEEYVGNIIEGRLQSPPSDDHTAPWLRSIVMRGLSRQPPERYPSMDALLEELDRDPEEELRQLRLVKRRRTIGWSLVVGLVVVMALVLAVRAQHRAQLRAACEGEASTIDGVWNREVGERIAQAFAESKVYYAKDTWRRARPHVDDYVVEWKAARTRVCLQGMLHKTRSADMLSRAKSCFDEQKARLGSLVAQWSSPNKTIIQKAAHSAQSLPLLRFCVDETELSRRVPQPSNPDTLAAMEKLTSQLAQAGVLEATGQYNKALSKAQSVISKALELDLAEIAVLARLSLGSAQRKAGRYPEAEATIETAFYEAEAAGDDIKALGAASLIVIVVGDNLAQQEEGIEWYKLAEGKIGRLALEPDHPDVAKTLNYGGLVYGKKGDLEQAEKMYQRALAIEKKTVGPDHPLVTRTLNNFGIICRRKGDYDQAEKLYQRAISIDEKALGPDHPDLTSTLNNMGNVFYMQGKYDKALTYHRKALAIREKTLRPEHPEMAKTLGNMGGLFEAQGKYGKALEYFRKALAIREKTLGPEHPLVAKTLGNMGNVFLNQGRYDKALEYYRKALVFRETTLGPKHPLVASTLNDMGNVFLNQGGYDKALVYYRKALVIDEKAHGKDHPLVASGLNRLGNLALIKKRYSKAKQLFRRSLDICAKRNCAPADSGRARFGMARILWFKGVGLDRAKDLARQAREDYLKYGKSHQDELDEVEAWLSNHAR